LKTPDIGSFDADIPFKDLDTSSLNSVFNDLVAGQEEELIL